MSSENVLNFLSQPAALASLAAVAAASMAYFTSRPTPQKCPVDPNQQSVEVPVSLTLSWGNTLSAIRTDENCINILER